MSNHSKDHRRRGDKPLPVKVFRTHKTTSADEVAGDEVLSLFEQRRLRRYDNLDPEVVCEADRPSYSNPDHVHVCTSPDGHRPDDGHTCPCGDWWHD